MGEREKGALVSLEARSWSVSLMGWGPCSFLDKLSSGWSGLLSGGGLCDQSLVIAVEGALAGGGHQASLRTVSPVS